jgi:hypothetical protein
MKERERMMLRAITSIPRLGPVLRKYWLLQA